MKKSLKRCFSVILVSAFVSSSSIGNLSIAHANDINWIEGWTGKEGSNNFNFEKIEDGIVIQSTKVNNGKFTDAEDSIVYYASEVNGELDFELSATVSIDQYNVMEESSNPQQGSVGIAILDELFNKSDDKAYTNSVFLGTWAKNKNDKLAFYSIIRDNSELKTINNKALSESFENSGTDLGSFNLSIKKEGSIYTFTCGENSQTYEVKSFTDTLYPCFYIARNAKATFSNVKLEIQDKKLLSLDITPPAKKVYTYGESLDTTDMRVIAKYDDGSEEAVDDYIIKGFYPNKIGKQTVSINKGNVSSSFEVEVEKIKCTNIVVKYEPIKTLYYTGSKFNVNGMEVIAQYDNGTSEVLDLDNYTMQIGSKDISNGYILNESLVGKQTVKIYRNNEDGISKGSTVGSFNIEVKKPFSSEIEIAQLPVKDIYYVGDKIDLAGLEVKYNVKSSLGEVESEYLKSNEYNISGFDSSKPGKNIITVTYNGDSNKTATFEVEVKQRSAIGIELLKYPRTTYSIGESFSDDNMIVAVLYDNGDVEEDNSCYSIDTSNFNTDVEGKTSITIIPNNSAFDSIKLDAMVIQEKDHKWRKAVFGQSSGSDKQDTGEVKVTAESYGTVDGTINVRAWEGNGKITGDHDGMVYYYTRVSGENNFSLTADIKVNKYLEHNNDDTKRNGQEAFGIMARDVVPLVGKDGERTINVNDAQLDEDGVPITHEKNVVFASNIAIAGGYSGTGWPNDPTVPTYEKNTKLNRINLYVRDGVTAVDGGGSKVGPYAISSSFPAEGNTYRINLSRVNGGMYARCYDYQTGETNESYVMEDDLLTIQNSDYAYVGFFAARWADIDVSNVEFFETNKTTDQVIEQEKNSEKTPEVSIVSNLYTDNKDYKLEIEVGNASGMITVKKDNKIIAKDMKVNSGITSINTKLSENEHNKFTVLFTPENTLSLTSYEDIIVRSNVTHRNFDKTAQIVYVSNEGNFKADGTKENPYDLDTAVGFIDQGQTIVMLEGIYKRTEPIIIPLGNNGTADKRKSIIAQEGKEVIIDLQKVSAGAVVTGNYWSIKGIDFTNSGDNLKAFHLGGSNCIIEDCKFYNNGDMGLQISRTYSNDDFSSWPANNLILNCESYNNCDPSMINADGFGAKLTVGNGNIFRNCSSHHNVDDGWDLYTKVNTGAIGQVTLENCVSYKNGYRLLENGTEVPYGSGGHNGFKLGGENVYVQHKLVNCIAYGNDANGVTTNSNPALSLTNVLSYDNADANFRLYSDKPAEYDYNAQGCVSFNGGEADVIGTVNRDEKYTNASINPIISDNNYFIFKAGEEAININNDTVTQEDVQNIEKVLIAKD